MDSRIHSAPEAAIALANAFGGRVNSNNATRSNRQKSQESLAMHLTARLIVVLAFALTPFIAQSEEIGRVGVDWVGNDIIVEAIPDPKVKGVTCHISYFDRSMWDRLSKGNWFEDPSNASIACRQTGPITIGDIDSSESGENVFSEGRSLVFKSLNVTRIFDQKNQVLVYLTHATELSDGSAKMSISTVPLYNPAAVKP
ncbi:MAG: hypothetical protein JWS11_2608 [Cypionkella sp.]|nr:hypothetical protein [Cypionkella sp.]